LDGEVLKETIVSGVLYEYLMRSRAQYPHVLAEREAPSKVVSAGGDVDGAPTAGEVVGGGHGGGKTALVLTSAARAGTRSAVALDVEYTLLGATAVLATVLASVVEVFVYLYPTLLYSVSGIDVGNSPVGRFPCLSAKKCTAYCPTEALLGKC
jgi:hypothetical protein